MPFKRRALNLFIFVLVSILNRPKSQKHDPSGVNNTLDIRWVTRGETREFKLIKQIN